MSYDYFDYAIAPVGAIHELPLLEQMTIMDLIS
jgi:hypothetical protein